MALSGDGHGGFLGSVGQSGHRRGRYGGRQESCRNRRGDLSRRFSPRLAHGASPRVDAPWRLVQGVLEIVLTSEVLIIVLKRVAVSRRGVASLTIITSATPRHSAFDNHHRKNGYAIDSGEKHCSSAG